MRRTNIYLEDEQCDHLDAVAHQEGISRAEVIRRLIDRSLAAGERGLDADVEAIAASFGALRDIDVEVRGHDDRATHLDAMWRLGS